MGEHQYNPLTNYELSRHPHARFGSALYCENLMVVKFNGLIADNYRDWHKVMTR